MPVCMTLTPSEICSCGSRSQIWKEKYYLAALSDRSGAPTLNDDASSEAPRLVHP
jgi:hypothetical protein